MIFGPSCSYLNFKYTANFVRRYIIKLFIENDRTTEASRAAINPTSYIDKCLIPINICRTNSGTWQWFNKKIYV